MSDPYITNGAATLAFTADSTNVVVAGTNAILAGVLAGDLALDPHGLPLALDAVAASALTLVRPAPTTGTVAFRIMKGPFRALVAEATLNTRDVWAQITAWSDRGLAIPVIAQQNAPPSTPADGDRYLVGTSGSGAWSGKNNLFATWSDTASAWLFTTPVAGWTAHIIGSFARLHYSGSAWGVAPPISSTTTVGRLARFTDTAGGLGQSQMAEDGSGNVSVAASLSAGAEIQARDGANYARLYRSSGYVRLASNAREMLALDDSAGTGHLINYAGSWATIWHSLLPSFSAAGSMTLGGDLTVSRSNSGGAVQHSIYNSATGAAAVARLFLQTGTANSTLNFQINDNSGSPYVVEQGGAAITAKYTDYDQHLWRSKAGVLWAQLASGNFTLGAGTGQRALTIDGGSSGSNNGASIVGRHAGALAWGLGTKSAVFGGAFSSNVALYSPTAFELYGGNVLSMTCTSSLNTSFLPLKVTAATQALIDIERTGGMVVTLVTTAPSLDGLRITTYAQPTTFENITDYYSNGFNRGAINGWHRFFATATTSAGPAFEVRHTDVRSNLKFKLTGGEGSQLEIVGATKTWGLNVANATGEAYFQNVTDSRFPFTIDAAAPTHSLRLQSAKVTLGLPLELKAYTLGTLPSAAAHSGETVRVTDGASNKQIVTSDGSVWRYSDGTSV